MSGAPVVFVSSSGCARYGALPPHTMLHHRPPEIRCTKFRSRFPSVAEIRQDPLWSAPPTTTAPSTTNPIRNFPLFFTSSGAVRYGVPPIFPAPTPEASASPAAGVPAHTNFPLFFNRSGAVCYGVRHVINAEAVVGESLRPVVRTMIGETFGLKAPTVPPGFPPIQSPRSHTTVQAPTVPPGFPPLQSLQSSSDETLLCSNKVVSSSSIVGPHNQPEIFTFKATRSQQVCDSVRTLTRRAWKLKSRPKRRSCCNLFQQPAVNQPSIPKAQESPVLSMMVCSSVRTIKRRARKLRPRPKRRSCCNLFQQTAVNQPSIPKAQASPVSSMMVSPILHSPAGWVVDFITIILLITCLDDRDKQFVDDCVPRVKMKSPSFIPHPSSARTISTLTPPRVGIDIFKVHRSNDKSSYHIHLCLLGLDPALTRSSHNKFGLSETLGYPLSSTCASPSWMFRVLGCIGVLAFGYVYHRRVLICNSSYLWFSSIGFWYKCNFMMMEILSLTIGFAIPPQFIRNQGLQLAHGSRAGKLFANVIKMTPLDSRAIHHSYATSLPSLPFMGLGLLFCLDNISFLLLLEFTYRVKHPDALCKLVNVLDYVGTWVDNDIPYILLTPPGM